MQDLEKLGAFYLGRVFDPRLERITDRLLLYDSKDLTTHAVCAGMTGSGKTGLCVTLLEEAGIDGIPAIAIDPKGDLANLFLTFPELRPSDFQPWVDPTEAARKGTTPEQYASQVARTWKEGLADWGQDGTRIVRFREACELAIYTPGSLARRPLRVLRSLAAPDPKLVDDPDVLGERIQGVVSSLLSLLGIEADPIRSREQILLTNLIERVWREGHDYEIPGLIADIQSPPFERLGVMDLESVFPAKDRFELAISFNNLLASPGFAAWMEGEPLDIGGLLYTDGGKPRLSILSIAHLSERERMFFVTLLLNEVVSWVRAQPGTSSLRALLYMDEVLGYFPPSKNPPSKAPMLTLLKQARAQGLGVMLATQNPVDLDYKGLSNAETWFLGRLQTERDKERVLDGLEGAAAGAAEGYDRTEMDRLLSGLGNRVFVVSNVHEDRPELFQTRWALSYLRGPLTRDEIRDLASLSKQKAPIEPAPAASITETERSAATDSSVMERALLPDGISELFLRDAKPVPSHARIVYRPRLLGAAQLHYANARADIDHWEEPYLTVALREPLDTNPWGSAEVLLDKPELTKEPHSEAAFANLPAKAMRPRNYDTWAKQLKTALYRHHQLTVLRCAKLRVYSRPGQTEGQFLSEVRQRVRERRDLEMEKLRKRYAPKLARLEDRIRQAEVRIAREKSQHGQQKLDTAISLGATVLGALFGRKTASAGNVARASRTLRGAGRIKRDGDDVRIAMEQAQDLRGELEELEAEFEKARSDLVDKMDFANFGISEVPIRPRKADISIDRLALLWVPWVVSADGIAEPGF